MPKKWVLPDHRRLVRVPRKLCYEPLHAPYRPVTFSTNGWPGVRVRDVLNNTVMVDAPYDTPFLPYGWRTTRVSLEWPGYHHRPDLQKERINTVMPGQQPITRQVLAQYICSILQNFCQSVKRLGVTPTYGSWALKDDHIGLMHIFLLSIHYYQDQWVPEFYVFE